jgi:hypothetical protein
VQGVGNEPGQLQVQPAGVCVPLFNLSASASLCDLVVLTATAGSVSKDCVIACFFYGCRMDRSAIFISNVINGLQRRDRDNEENSQSQSRSNNIDEKF